MTNTPTVDGGHGGPAETIIDREKTHGDFTDTALVAQSLKGTLRRALRDRPANWTHIEALDAICTKLARIVCGDADHADHWHDIAGYAMLIEQSLKKKKE